MMVKHIDKSILYDPCFRDIFDKCPVKRFQRIDNLPGLSKLASGPIVIMHLQKSIDKIAPQPDTIDLSWIKIHYLQSLKVLCGYAFELPSLYVTIDPIMIKIYKPQHRNKEIFTDVQVQFSNAHFTVFNAQDQAMLIVQHSEHKLD